MVTGRCGLLGLFISLLTLLCLMREGSCGMIAAAVAYGLARCSSKESACIVPVLFLAIVVDTHLEQATPHGAPCSSRRRELSLFGGSAGHRHSGRARYRCLFGVCSWWSCSRKISRSLYGINGGAGAFVYGSRFARDSIPGWEMAGIVCLIGYGLWRYPRALAVFFIHLDCPCICSAHFDDGFAQPFIRPLGVSPALPGFLLPIAMGMQHGLNSSRPRLRAATRLGIGLLFAAWIGLSQVHTLLRLSDRAFYHWSAQFSASDVMRAQFRSDSNLNLRK